jgi:uncharacterized YigZ family protein
LDLVDHYKTISKVSPEVLYKEKGSKFLGYAFPISSEEEVASVIQDLKVKHHKARHWCYAWRLGVENETFRVNDDGEPNNSAGQPIYGQLLSHELTNVLVVVVRYFGGTKLGVGGLVQAYKTAANLALESSKIIQKTVDVIFEIKFDYAHMNKIMRIIKEENIYVLEQKMEISCCFKLAVRKREAENVRSKIENLRCATITELE